MMMKKKFGTEKVRGAFDLLHVYAGDKQFKIKVLLIETKGVDKTDIFNWSIFVGNNFYYIINHLNMNHVAIYKKKYILAEWPTVISTICFGYILEKKSKKLWIPKMKLSRINNVCFTRKVLANFEKVTGFLNPFFHLSEKVYILILALHKMFSLSCYLIVWRWL